MPARAGLVVPEEPPEMRHLLKLAIAAVLSFVILPSVAVAHPNHARKVLGTVADITSERLTLEGAKGVQTTLVLTRDTAVVRAGKPADIKDVTVGTRVVVTTAAGKEPLVAQRVEITPVKTSTAAPR